MQNVGPNERDHGGGLDAAISRFGGSRDTWLDLSTGINPNPYPRPHIPDRFWHALPDQGDQSALKEAARAFWDIPENAGIAAASGVSALIAALPRLAPAGHVGISQPTYNEHAASFTAFGWTVQSTQAATNVYVHPNNPDGRTWERSTVCSNHKDLTIIDESFCDTSPEKSLIELSCEPGYVVLKGLGKFWGLAGLRLGFAIAHPETIAQVEHMLGPWAISGPAQHVGKIALLDKAWAKNTRTALQDQANHLDQLMLAAGAKEPCGTTLFRTYTMHNAQAWFEKLANAHILSRVFPYSDTMIRLGLPGNSEDWVQLKNALERI